jgi:nucleoside-diphosphate-sugar epimerase
VSTVLVTGGAGFVGAYVTRALLAEGHRVVVYDVRPSRNALGLVLDRTGDREGGDLVIEQGEITDGWRLLRTCRRHRVDQVVHLASPLTQDVTDNPVTGIRDVCLGTATMFEVAREAALGRLVWASSVAVFGPASAYPPGPLAYDACHRPTTLYGSAKSLCEQLARRAWEVDGVDSVGLRLTVVYGAGRLRGYMSYPSQVLRQAAAGGPVVVDFGAQRLNWQYVDEVAAMVSRVLASPTQGAGRTFNTYGDARTWAEAAGVLRRVLPDVAVEVREGLDPALDGVVEAYDDSAFREHFGYEPRWPLERGVAATVETYSRIIAEGLEVGMDG